MDLDIERANQAEGSFMRLPVSVIRPNPHQPRKIFEESALTELADSIRLHGLIQPVTVKATSDGHFYELIAGERRWRAATEAGLSEVPAIVLDVSDAESASMALIENLQRENLHYLEEAEGYSNLLHDFGLTQEELAERIGKSQATIANKLRILRLDPNIKAIILKCELTERHARALLRLPDTEQQLKVVDVVVRRQLNVKQTEEVITQLLEAEKQKKKPKPIRVFKDIRIFVNTIKQAVDLMNEAGVEAISEKKESEDFIEYIIKIPKK